MSNGTKNRNSVRLYSIRRSINMCVRARVFMKVRPGYASRWTIDHLACAFVRTIWQCINWLVSAAWMIFSALLNCTTITFTIQVCDNGKILTVERLNDISPLNIILRSIEPFLPPFRLFLWILAAGFQHTSQHSKDIFPFAIYMERMRRKKSNEFARGKKNSFDYRQCISTHTFKAHNVMNMDAIRYRERQAILMCVYMFVSLFCRRYCLLPGKSKCCGTDPIRQSFY